MSKLNPFPNDNVLNSSKLKEFADDNFKFDENDRKFTKWAENTVGKGEIARHEQFLLSQSVFKRHIPQTRKNQGLSWEGLIQYWFENDKKKCRFSKKVLQVINRKGKLKTTFFDKS